MDFNFPLLLVVLTAACGVVWWVGRWLLLPARRRRARAIEAMTDLNANERAARIELVLREPVAVEYARSFLPVLLAILVVRSFIVEPFKIPSGSMMPTVVVGDFILVNKFSYGLRLPVLDRKVLGIGEPARGDVIVFRHPDKPGVNYIKRVVGVPGDDVSYANKTLRVNGIEVAADYVGPYTGPSEPNGRSMAGGRIYDETMSGEHHRMMTLPSSPSVRDGAWKVPDGQYFVMGDSRDNSEDSRFWGFVPEANLVGKAFAIWMNFSGGIDFSRIGTIIR